MSKYYIFLGFKDIIFLAVSVIVLMKAASPLSVQHVSLLIKLSAELSSEINDT